jgi:uncharacterized circularly permuted ATP-grasp superfamily protein
VPRLDPVATVESIRSSARLVDYEPLPGCHDEAFSGRGQPRDGYAGLLACVDAGPPARIAASIGESLASRGVNFRSQGSDGVFPIDAVPRLLSASEQEVIERGLAQRAVALDSFIADAYGDRRIVAAGAVPERVISDSQLYEPLMRGVEAPGGAFAHVCGPDLVRDSDGEFLVLEDNLRSPSGLSYALEARRAVAQELPLAHFEPLPIEGAIVALGAALRAAAPESASEARIVLLSDGPDSPAWFEHRSLAARLEISLVQPGDLRVTEGRLWSRSASGRAPIDVIYRRTVEERLSGPDGRLTNLGELLAEPIRAGTVAIANAFGTGVGDDKLAHAYAERMIDFYLGEEPILRSVPTLDLGETAQRDEALERLDEMVIKRRGGLGGGEVHILHGAGREERNHVEEMIRSDPQYIAQERIELSTHPTVSDGSLEPRRVDLRPFAIRAGDGYQVARAALTRYAPSADSLFVNSSLGGGGKDTWVVA